MIFQCDTTYKTEYETVHEEKCDTTYKEECKEVEHEHGYDKDVKCEKKPVHKCKQVESKVLHFKCDFCDSYYHFALILGANQSPQEELLRCAKRNLL